MLESLLVAVNACVPYIIYLSIGYFSREKGVANEVFFNKLNTYTFKLFFPCLMFYNFYNIDISGLQGGYMLFCAALIIASILILCLVIPRIVKEKSEVSTIIQAIYRSNYLLFGVPMAETIFGTAGAELGSIVLAVSIPIYNVSAVLILEGFRGGKVSPKELLIRVLTTPLIMGAIAGSIFLVFRIPVPECILQPVGKLSSLSTPIAIITLGGTLHFDAIGKNLRYLVPSLAVKLFVLPLIAVALAIAMGYSPLQRFIVYVLFGGPVAAASYPMAKNMGGDGELAGQFVVLSTVAAVIVMFGWIVVMRSIGII